MSVHDRIDPKSPKPRGLLRKRRPRGSRRDPRPRRAPCALGAVMAMAGTAAPPSDDIETSDHLVPGPRGAPEVPIRVYRPNGCGCAAARHPRTSRRRHDHRAASRRRTSRHRPRREQRLRRRVGRIPAGARAPGPRPGGGCTAALVAIADRAADFGIDSDRLVSMRQRRRRLAAGRALMARGSRRSAADLADAAVPDARRPAGNLFQPGVRRRRCL